MILRRREFLGASLSAATLLAMRARAQERTAATAAKAAKPLKVLVFGGTAFLGPAVVDAAKARGHEVTLFNRGKTNPHLYPELEKLRGDRDPLKGDGLKALEGRKWDVVFDDCGYYPRMVQASAELLAPNVGQYVFVSSISCYAKNEVENADEDAELATMADPTLETMGKGYEYYGALKALCEQASEKAFPERATIVRPGYIVGPLDWSGRFNYWCVRFDRGGEILVPGAASDPIQVIDVRDLGEWMVKLAEDKTHGRFNACGPKERLTWGNVIEACKKASSAKEIKVHWASLEKMNALKDVEPFNKVEFPIWSAYDGESKGFHTWSNKRAVAAGLTFRPIETIAKDTLAWWKTVPDGERAKKLGGPTEAQEAEMIKKLA